LITKNMTPCQSLLAVSNS